MDDSEEFQSDSEMAQEPVTERVRIYGAEPAGAVSSGQSVAETPGTQLTGAGPPALPHWTDPPTGQVPAIVDRRANGADSDPLTPPGGGPSWREHDHEWDDETFEPSLLADEDTRVGALSDSPVSERQPWEFDDLSPPGGMRPRGAHEGEPDDDESWWEDDTGSAAGSWERDEDREEGEELRSFPVGTELGEPVTTRMAVSSPSGESPLGSSGHESTFVASISSSPLRNSSVRHGSSSVRRRGHRHPLRSDDHAGGGAGLGNQRNMPVAIATGVGFAAVALGCFAAGPLATLVLATVVMTLASAECYAALRKAGRRPATLLGLVATVGVMVSVYAKGVAALPLVLALLVVTSMVWYLVGAERGPAVEGIATTVLTFAWIGVLSSFAALLLAPSQFPDRHGVAFVLGAVVATVSADVGALAVGRWLGRHPLAPRVSPHKTWEGLIGGAVTAVVVSVLLTGQVHPWTPAKAAVLGIVVAVLAPVGDLCESLVKRDLGLKDMGSLLPGHGGVLDRVDAMLFVLPATYYLVRVLHLG